MIVRAWAWWFVATAATIALLQSVQPADAQPIGSVVAAFAAPAQAMDDDAEEQSQIGQAGRNVVLGLKRFAKQVYFSLSRVVARWENWMRRLLPFLPIVVVAALADRGLIDAWRSQGIRVLATYVPLMLYVYLRLLLTTKVRIMGKVALGAALAYGLVRHDLITDRIPITGYVDDAVLIVAATRLFLYTCPESLVSSFADAAVRWRRRWAALQRARNR